MTEQQQTSVSAAPPMPDTPPTPEAPPAAGVPPQPPPGRDRRVLRAVLRWTAAVVVFAAAGAGTAYGIAGMDRTDVPGLATASDGRWDYPTLTKPPLPSGSPGPFAEDNAVGAHHADLRALVLPAPRGATEDKALRGTDGWLETEDFLAEYARQSDRKKLGQQLTDHGLRHVAARGWTTRDGTHTRIYLLRFNTAVPADDLVEGELAPYDSPGFPVRGAETSVHDEDFPPQARIDDISYSVYTEAKPYGAEQVRHAYLTAGDTLAVIIQSRRGTAAAVPFQQTVALQGQLLA
ncbi:hypothetical protein [Streptomyces kebangsaanensis]|uniref:hypothetical protein n=1 Tax=Streptomyces kebangsaanensis TaxID=864058 RepID=UPI00093DF56A|nr:hypothetical protein [Streptomyces kebangsaanensis]